MLHLVTHPHVSFAESLVGIFAPFSRVVALCGLAMGFSVEIDSSLFGLDNSTDEYQLMLNAATAFGRIRKDLDRNITLLKTFTARQFIQRKNHHLFRENVERLVNDDGEGSPVFPLLFRSQISDGVPNPTATINQLILALFSLTPTNLDLIKRHGLVETFPALFRRVVRDCFVFIDVRQKFISIMENACRDNKTAAGEALLSESRTGSAQLQAKVA